MEDTRVRWQEIAIQAEGWRRRIWNAVCVQLVLALPAACACAPLPGAGQLWAKPSIRYIVVGETHGTAETPAAFADLVCAALHSKRTVVAAPRTYG